jgi:hypothetical protein
MLIQIFGWVVSTTGIQAQTQEELAQALREMRDILLKESDWTQVPDCPLSEEIKNDWRIWRQAMRDITSTVSYPLANTIQLPVTPETGRPSTWSNWDLNDESSLWTIKSNASEEHHDHTADIAPVIQVEGQPIFVGTDGE